MDNNNLFNNIFNGFNGFHKFNLSHNDYSQRNALCKMTKYPPDNDFEKLLQEKSQTLSKLCPDHKSYFDIYYHKYGDNDYKIKIPLAAIQYDEDMDDISDIIKFKKCDPFDFSDSANLLIDYPIFDCKINNLPPKLVNLKIPNSNIISIHIFPDTITRLNISYNDLINIPTLPPNLTDFDCSNNPLKELPELSNTLEKLSCKCNGLYYLPKLPPKLIHLNCSYNQIVTLGKLPYTLEYLDCSNTNIVRLLNNVHNVKTLYIQNTKISNITLTHPNSFIIFNNTPLEKKIKTYDSENEKNESLFYDSDLLKERIFKINKINAANKIREWFLDCKYNPKYKYCCDRLEREFNEMFIKKGETTKC